MFMSSLVIFTEQSGVLLRQLRPEHAVAYFDTVDANREHLSQFGNETAAKYPTLETVEDSIVKPTDKDKLRFGIWAAGVFVGSINAEPMLNGRNPDADRAEMGYWLDRRHTGHGYVTTALKAISSYAADHIGRPFARVMEGNEKSVAVLERAGFTHTYDKDQWRYFELLEVVS